MLLSLVLPPPTAGHSLCSSDPNSPHLPLHIHGRSCCGRWRPNQRESSAQPEAAAGTWPEGLPAFCSDQYLLVQRPLLVFLFPAPCSLSSMCCHSWQAVRGQLFQRLLHPPGLPWALCAASAHRPPGTAPRAEPDLLDVSPRPVHS